MFWLFPAISSIASMAAGGIKSAADNEEYRKQMETRKRRSHFSAFTGDNVNQTPEPERPSTARTMLGSAISGANFGIGLGSGIQALSNNASSNLNFINPYNTMRYAIPANTQFNVNPMYAGYNPWTMGV